MWVGRVATLKVRFLCSTMKSDGRGRNTEKEMGKKNMNIFYFLFHLRIILNNNSNSIYIQHLKILSHLLSFAYVIF